MDRYNLLTIKAIVILMILSGCDSMILDPAGVLDQDPQDRYTGKVVWSDISMADSYLRGIYRNLDLKGGFDNIINLDAVSDDIFFIHDFGTSIYVQGNLSASNQGPFGDGYFSHISWQLYDNVQRINLFLANIDEVLKGLEGSELADVQERVDRMKGEALFLRAFSYTQMAMTYGGLPIITQPSELTDDFSSIKRATFKETIDFISQECDAAAALLLPKGEMEMGRATKGAALALKSRILLFAASDLTADGSAESKYVGYANPDRTALWQAAKNAAKAVMNLGIYNLADFGAPDQAAVAENYYNFFLQKDLSNPAIIWGVMFVKDAGDRRQTNLFNGPNGLNNWGANNPTADLVDSYQMNDGSNFFDHFKINSSGYYENISSKYTNDNPYKNRAPRFYASILYDQAVWQPRFANLAERDPIGVYDRRTRRVIENGEVIIDIPGIDTRQGPVVREDGGYTGYLMKKHMDREVIGRSEHNDNAWIEFRYAEVLLNYAEACMELGETAEASKYINIIRNRAAMPDFTGNIENALRHERRIELVLERKRWYDIRRWKLLEEELTDVYGMHIVETTNRDNGTVITTWQQIKVQDRRVTSKMSWIPVPADEINRAPQLVQNPGY